MLIMQNPEYSYFYTEFKKYIVNVCERGVMRTHHQYLNVMNKCLKIIFFFVACLRYLNLVHNIDMVPNQTWHCILSNTLMVTLTMCSTLFILSMTFDRCYSIIRPHKAASFNTIRKAKLSILLIVIFSILYNVPHLFITLSVDRECVPYGKAMQTVYGKFYYWLSFVVSFAAPFILLLIMNCFIIHIIRNRSKLNFVSGSSNGQGACEGQSTKGKSSERQIYITLLLVTFGFLILTTPAYIFLTYIMVVDYMKSPYAFAAYYLFYHVGHKLYNTNYGINFFLYVISGHKFRADVLRLFGCYKESGSEVSLGASASVNTVTSKM